MSERHVADAEPRPAEPTEMAAKDGTKHVIISTFDSPANPHYNGGGVAVIEMMARQLAQYFDVTVITVGHGGSPEMHNGVRYRQLPISWAGPRAGQLLFHALLPFVVMRTPHDLWIENFTPPFSTSFLPLFSRAPIVGFAQNLCGKEMSDRYRLPFFLVERLGLRFYRNVVVLNSAHREIVRHFSPSTTVQVIPNGIDKRPLNEEVLSRRDHILFLGRIDITVKGLDLLLAAYEMSGLAMPLLIAGSGTPNEERKLAELLTATRGDIRRVGHVTGERKRELLEGSAIVMMPSRYETFGLAALEGMSYAKPVVHFDLPTLRWIGDVSVPSFDVGALAGAMRDLADNESARRELGRTAHATSQRYSSDTTLDRYLSLVQGLLNEPSSVAGEEGGTPCQ